MLNVVVAPIPIERRKVLVDQQFMLRTIGDGLIESGVRRRRARGRI
jgi:hypothetical protein